MYPIFLHLPKLKERMSLTAQLHAPRMNFNSHVVNLMANFYLWNVLMKKKGAMVLKIVKMVQMNQIVN